MKKLIKKYLTYLYEIDPIIYLYTKISAHFFSIFNISKNKRLSKIYAKNFYQGLKNAEQIPLKLKAIWPFWVYQQFLPGAKFFSSKGFQPFIPNTIYRNWTTLSYPNQDEKIIVDPYGLITPFSQGWSLDFWIYQNNQLYPPFKLDLKSQTLIKNLPHIQTTLTNKTFKISTSAFFKKNQKTENLLFVQSSITNISEKPQNFSFFWAIRPYNPEGVSPIYEINYLSSQAFVINNQLATIFSEKPQNIVCLNNQDGDISERISSWEMILSTKCSAGQASAFVEYQISLLPHETKTLNLKIPTKPNAQLTKLFQKALKPYQAHLLSRRINRIKSYNYQEEQKQFNQLWDKLDENLCMLNLPDKKIENVFHQNLYHLLNFIGKKSFFAGSFTYKEFWLRDTVFAIRTLNRIGASNYSETIIKNFISSKKPSYLKQELDYLGLSIFSILDTYQYTQNKLFLEQTFPFIEKTIHKFLNNRIKNNSKHSYLNGILKKSYSFNLTGKPDNYLWDNFWALAGLKSAHQIANIIGKTEKADKYLILEKNFKDIIEKLIIIIFEKQTQKPYIPISPTRSIDSDLIYNLISVYPLEIYAPHDILITNTLEYIENYFTKNNIFFSDIGHVGFPAPQNCLLAQTYLKRQNPKAFKIINWLTQSASPTGCWPESIHPQTQGGIAGDGHYAWASAEYLNLIRNLIISEGEKSLTITPFIPPNWLQKDQNQIHIKNLATKFGKVNFSIYYKSNKIEVMLDNEFHTPPQEMSISAPTPILKIITQNTQRDVYNTQVHIPITAKKLELHLLEK